MLPQVLEPALQCVRVWLGDACQRGAAVELQSPKCGHQRHAPRPEAGRAAFDVQKLLGAELEAEAGLGDDFVGVGQAEPGAQDTGAPVGDVPEGPGVDNRRTALARLDKVGKQGVLEQRSHGAGGLELPGGHRLAR